MLNFRNPVFRRLLVSNSASLSSSQRQLLSLLITHCKHKLEIQARQPLMMYDEHLKPKRHHLRRLSNLSVSFYFTLFLF